MSNWPIRTDAPLVGGANAANEYAGVSVTAPGSTNTKSAWTVITSGNSVASAGFALHFSTIVGSGNFSGLVDIAIGSAGNEVVVAADIALAGPAYNAVPPRRFVPVFIPANTPVSIRYQSRLTGQGLTMTVLFFPFHAATPMASRCVTIGADTTNSSGIQVDVVYSDPGTIYALSSSTPIAARAVQVRFTYTPSPSGGTYGWAEAAFRLYVGAASSEVMVLDWTAVSLPLSEVTVWMPLPAGVRLSCRLKLNNVSNRYAALAYLYQ